METEENQGQGQPNEGGTVQGGEGQEVQSGSTEQGNQGQGFLDPYLKDVPEDQRPVVEPILERYRQEQDANFNRRFEQIQEEARVPTMIHQALIQDPVQTLNWIADRMLEEQGVDVRQELLNQWGQSQQQSGQESQNADPQSGQEQGALTAEDVERILAEREQQAQQQAQQQQFQQQQIEQQQRTINGWIDNASKSFSLPLDDTNGEDPLRAVIIMQANQLHEAGVAKGQAAVEMAVESIAKRFGGNAASNSNGQPSAKVADGGSPPPAEPIDVSNEKERRARMLELFGPVSSDS